VSPLESYTTAELRELLAASEEEMRTLRKQGLPHFALGKGFRYPKASAHAFFEARLVVREPQPRTRRHDAGSAAGTRTRATSRPGKRFTLRAG
jgi:hypothetical protein